MYSAFENIKEI